MLNRRIGQNELAVIEVCKAIADAQREYALRDPDGNGVREYARKFISDPASATACFGPRPKAKPSPLGEFAAGAAAEGYSSPPGGPDPVSRLLLSHPRSRAPVPRRALDYVVNGKMTLGFAVIAYPADTVIPG